jgi:hypothetical protein
LGFLKPKALTASAVIVLTFFLPACAGAQKYGMLGAFEASAGSTEISLSIYSSNSSAAEIIGGLASAARKPGQKAVNSDTIRKTAAIMLDLTCGQWDGKWYYFASIDGNGRMTLYAAGDYPEKCFYLKAEMAAGQKESRFAAADDFMQYPGAVPGAAITLKCGGQKNFKARFFRVFNAAPADVGTFYRASMIRAGWKIKEANGSGTQDIFFGEKGDDVIAAGFSPGENNSTIVAILG